MNSAVFGKQRAARGRGLAAAILSGLLLTLSWAGSAEARFTCGSNADCADTAIGCGDGHCGPSCWDGVCAPNDPESDNIGCILVPNNAKCDNGDFCDGAEICNSKGNCEDTPPPTCDDQIPCTLDSCDSLAAQCKHVARNSLCSNGLFCDGREVCDLNDGCKAGTPPRCGDGVSCTVDTCDETNDTCIHAPNNGACSNGVFCDGVEVCNLTQGCQAAARTACDDGFSCTADTCNEANDTCGHTGNDALCSNGQFCDGVETCSLSKGCQAGTPVNCGDGVSCTTDACNENSDSCTHTVNNAACSNGQFCDGVEVCNLTQGCQAGTPVNCADNFACTADSCNEGTDSCVNAPNNAACSNGQFCDGVETCSASQGCLAGTAPNCGDGISCTIDTCNESTDSCNHVTSDALCNDGQFCDGVETCSATNDCQPGTPPDCSDKIACTANSCNETTDSCDVIPNDSLCSNGQFCDGAETCNIFKGCQAGTAPCGDGVACTTDLCSESTDKCTHVPNNGACDDGRYCDGVETCDVQAGCQEGTPPNCADEIDCTIDECVEATDSCSHTESNVRCDDGLYCNGKEVCDVLIGCYDAKDPNCSDNVDCTVDACVEETDSCSHTTSNDLCANGKFCDGVETCDATFGCQEGIAPDCIDDIECTVDSCSEGLKACVNAPDNDFCRNGQFCDGNEVCNASIGCVAGTPISCNDSLSCTNDSCYEVTDQCLFVPNFSLCGNGTVEPNCGEQCDSDNGEICNNDIDDDGDLLIDCADPDCADKLTPTCSDTCQFVPACTVLLRDPAVIRYDASAGTRSTAPPGLFSFHARLMPTTPVDPAVDGFVVTLANANGVIFRADVKAVDINSNQRRWAYQAADPEKVAKEGGILRLGIVRRTFGDDIGYGFRVKVYGDFTGATVPRMTTQVYFGDDVGYVTAEWTGEPGHWVLRQRDYEGGR